MSKRLKVKERAPVASFSSLPWEIYKKLLEFLPHQTSIRLQTAATTLFSGELDLSGVKLEEILSSAYGNWKRSMVPSRWKLTGVRDTIAENPYNEDPPSSDPVRALVLHDWGYGDWYPVEDPVLWRWGRRVEHLRLVDFRPRDNEYQLFESLTNEGIKLKTLILEKLRTFELFAPRLKGLDSLERVEVIGPNDSRMGAQFWSDLAELPRLRTLRLAKSNFDEDYRLLFRFQASLARLEELTFEGIDAFEILGCPSLPPNLTSLTLINNGAVVSDTRACLDRRLLGIRHLVLQNRVRRGKVGGHIELTFDPNDPPVDLRELEMTGLTLSPRRPDDGEPSTFERWLSGACNLMSLCLFVTWGSIKGDAHNDINDMATTLRLGPLQLLRILSLDSRTTLDPASGPFVALEKFSGNATPGVRCLLNAPNVTTVAVRWLQTSQADLLLPFRLAALDMPNLRKLSFRDLGSKHQHLRVLFDNIGCSALRTLHLERLELFSRGAFLALPQLEELSCVDTRGIWSLKSLLPLINLKKLSLQVCPDLESIVGLNELLAILESFELKVSVHQFKKKEVVSKKDLPVQPALALRFFTFILTDIQELDKSLYSFLRELPLIAPSLSRLETHPYSLVPPDLYTEFERYVTISRYRPIGPP